jgi:carbamoyltransferase
MNILGISSYYHDSAASLIINGDIVAAAQEERFTRKKHDPGLPVHAMEYCLAFAGLKSSQLDAVCYYDNPFLTLDRWLRNCIAEGRNSEKLIEKSFESIFSRKLWIHEALGNALGTMGKKEKLLVCEHHISHASSAFYPSPFKSSAIITIDGVGEWATTTIGIGSGNDLKILKQINYPHSLGLLYSAMTYFCGFKVNSGEYKLMGLAPYGEARYYNTILDKLIEVKDDGSYRLNMQYFAYARDTVMTDDEFGGLFDGPRRHPESPITRREMDLAASIQKVTEDIMIKMARTARKITGEKNLCLAGGVALNCVANGKIFREKIFDQIWIQPAAGDAGGSLGCALYAYYHYYHNERNPGKHDTQKNSYLGPEYSAGKIAKYLDNKKIPYHRFESKDSLAACVARLLADDNAIGLFAGRMEFGPRALGNRSIIANPQIAGMQSKLNLKIKFRESFRPFAPTVLYERLGKYFDLDRESPYMLLVAQIRENLRLPFDLQAMLTKSAQDMLPIVNEDRSTIPAVTHVDYTARIQTITKADNPFYCSIIEEFEKLTGCAVIVNTSFNVRGEPIVCTAEQAYLCFMRTGLDVLVLEDCLLFKNEQQALEDDADWRNDYELD